MMRRLAVILLLMVSLAGCRDARVRNFWLTHDVDYSEVDSARSQFIDYAALASLADTCAARASIDRLYDKLKKDEVAYYLYTEWVEGIFYHPLSPYRSETIFSQAVERMETDGIFSEDECLPYRQRLARMRLNREGGKATVPGVSLDGRRTLVAVADLGCHSCIEALDSLATDGKWAEVRRVAISCGHSPEFPLLGWERVLPENIRDVFDIRFAPFCFVVSADGTVESSYKSISEL